MPGKFEVYQDRASKWRFRLKNSADRVVATGDAHETKAHALQACKAVIRAAQGARIEEVGQ